MEIGWRVRITWPFSANGRLFQIPNSCSPGTSSRRRILAFGELCRADYVPGEHKAGEALDRSSCALSYTIN
jgi:hypothetical protein